MHFVYELTRKILAGYDQVCGQFCHEQDIARTSFDILLFLANNPKCDTARDIVEVRHLKANLVSIHLDRLESSLQGSIFFDIHTVLIQCCRTDTVQFTTRQHWL